MGTLTSIFPNVTFLKTGLWLKLPSLSHLVFHSCISPALQKKGLHLCLPECYSSVLQTKEMKCCNVSEEVYRINQKVFLSLYQMQHCSQLGHCVPSVHSTQELHRGSGGGASKQNVPGNREKQDSEWATLQRRWGWQAILRLVNFSHNNGAKVCWLFCHSELARVWVLAIKQGITTGQVLSPLANRLPLRLPQIYNSNLDLRQITEYIYIWVVHI